MRTPTANDSRSAVRACTAGSGRASSTKDGTSIIEQIHDGFFDLLKYVLL
jgi:hypothetical protein